MVFNRDNVKGFLKEILPITNHKGWSWEVWEQILNKEWACELDIVAILYASPKKLDDIVDLAQHFSMLDEIDVLERLDHLIEGKWAKKESDSYELTQACRTEFEAFYQKNKELLDSHYFEFFERWASAIAPGKKDDQENLGVKYNG